jgi:hypothetical protein
MQEKQQLKAPHEQLQTTTHIEHIITTMSSLVALFAHGNTENYSPSAREMLAFLNDSAIPKDTGLRQAIEIMDTQIREIYKFDQEIVQQKAFPKVEARRLAGMGAVLTQNPDILIDLGCGAGPFLLDILKTKTDKPISTLGLDFKENIRIANIFMDELYPQFKNQANFYSTDLLNFVMLRAIFGIFIKSISEQTGTVENKQLCFYNQGLFRYLPKEKHVEFAAIIYEMTDTYPGEVVWIQTDNEILDSSSDISRLNGTQANIFRSGADMLATFSQAGWKTNWDGQTLILRK